MKKSLIMLTAFFLLVGCSSDKLAEKSNRCMAYEGDIKEKIELKDSYLTNPGPSHILWLSLKEVFFSRKLGTCIYVETKNLNDGPVNVMREYIVNDFYNEKELETFTIKSQRISTGNLAEFEKYILELKGK